MNRVFGGLFAASLLLTSAVSPALADHSRRGGALAHTTLLNVQNNSGEYITSIIAVQHSFLFGPSAQNLLHGVVRPGAVVMVNFPSCWSDIHITTKRHPSDTPIVHNVFNYDVCKHTTYTITRW